MEGSKRGLNYEQIILYLIVIPIGFIAVLRGLGWICRTIAPDLSVDISRIIIELLIAVPVFLVFKQTIQQGEKHILTPLRFLFCFLYLGIPFLVHAGMNIFGHEIQTGFANVLPAVLGAFAVAFCEELIFRGVIFNKVQGLLSGRKNVFLIAALLSSCAFGLVHFGNLIEQSLIGTVMQVYFAFATGLCFCGIYLFSGTLLVPILLHGIVDTGSFLLVENADATAASFDWIKMGLSTLILVIGLVLLIIYEKRVLCQKSNKAMRRKPEHMTGKLAHESQGDGEMREDYE